MNSSPAELHLTDPARRAIGRGVDTIRRASRGEKVLLAGLALVLVTLLPVGRTGPNGTSRLGGGIWKPLSVDAGLLFRHQIGIDFFSTYEAGARVLRGGDPYAVDPSNGLPGVRAPWFTTYRYLPIPAFVLGVPMNLFPPWTAYGLWVAINVGLLLLNFLLTVGRRPGALLPLALIWSAWFPFAVELYMGQYTFLMTTLLLWGMDGFLRRSAVGGWGWGGSVALKVYSVLMALPLWIWGYRRAVVVSLGAIGVATAGYFLVSPGSWRSFRDLNLENRWVLRERQPYAGAQGMQEAIDATVWALQGRDFARGFGESEPRPSSAADPVAWGTGLLMAAYVALLLWAVWKTRRAPSALTLGLFWLSWFYLYSDTWEHHTVLFQGLLAWWLVRGEVKPWQAVVAWIGAGTPSLWIPFSAAMARGGPGVSTVLGLLYFWQRPLAIGFVTVLAIRGLRRAPGGRRATDAIGAADSGAAPPPPPGPDGG